MSDVIQILIAKYADAATAEAALKKLHDAKENQGVEVDDAAVVRRDEHGKLHIHETDDVTGRRGAEVGGILGGVLGFIAGPPGALVGAAIGATVGGAAARVLDTGIPHKRLTEIGQGLPAHSAALIILTESGFVPFIEGVIGGDGVEIVVETMDAQAAAQMAHDHEIALKALQMGDALADGGAISLQDNE